jgi:hypothetical protein
MNVRIGRKRSSAGLVVHLSIGGDPCACGQKVNTTASAAAATARLCKRGFTAHRIAAAQQANSYAASRFDATVATILCAVVESRRTPAERAASAAKFAETQFAQDLAAAAADTYEDQLARRRQVWALLRDAHVPAARRQAA